MMNGIINFLTFIKENWTLITTIIGLLIWIGVKLNNYIKLSKEEKINMALDNVKNIMLSLVSSAEESWGSQTGRIKRSEVISKILEKYPILTEVITKDEIVNKIDAMIDEALEDMREILESKSSKEEE